MPDDAKPDFNSILNLLTMEEFLKAVRLAEWASRADKLGYEFAYIDGDVLMFRRIKEHAHAG